jgi:hypothetical protein
MKVTLSALIVFIFLNSYLAQDNLGIAGSSRAPMNTLLINPSSIVDSRAFIDINLAGVSVFARNDFAFLDGKSFSLSMFDTMTTVPMNRDKGPYHAYADVMVQGPGASFAVKQHAFAINTGVRVVADARGLPNKLSDLINQGFQYREQMGQVQSFSNVRTNALAWGEAGLTYGTILARDGNAILQGAASIKRLFGVAGAGVRLDNWTYIVRDSTRLETQNLNGEYGFNDPTAGLLNGKGWGFDLGFTYKVRKSNSDNYIPHSPCTDGDYLYRLGVSLLDFGRVSFNGPFYRNEFNKNESSEWENYQGTTANDIAGVDSLINSNFNLVQENSSDGRFRMKLPSAISVQLDYNLTHNFYVHGVMTYGLPRLNSLGVQRASYLGIVPRWEIKRFEVSLPVSLYEWQHPQFGLAMRLNSLIIGSDNLGGLLFNQDIYGADIYFSLKYTIFKHWKCKTKSKKAKTVVRRGNKDPLPCPSW